MTARVRAWLLGVLLVGGLLAMTVDPLLLPVAVIAALLVWAEEVDR